ncbi:MAG: DNA alkylation repair protein, partial [Bacteroidetes bacterium]|nr:DNA alkylation repair protein [Bacteroidota bacterium]
MSDQYLQSLIQVLEKAADPTNATQMKRYMKDRYEFFGIKAPECKELVAPFFVKDGLPSKDEYEDIVRNAWNEPQRELQYFAMELTFKVRKYWEESTLELLEFMILNKSWWDSVDY